MHYAPLPQTDRKAMLAIAGAVLLGACGAAAEPSLIPVNQYLAQCDALKGKMVRVAGYLGACAGYSCRLFPDKAGMVAADQHFRAMMARRPGEAIGAEPPEIGIGGETEFDRKAAPLQGSYVVIAGRVADDTCTSVGGTDRSAGIEPTDIRAWRPDEGAPTNTQ